MSLNLKVLSQKSIFLTAAGLLGASILSSCNFAPLPQGGFTPTVEEVTITVPASPERSATPSPTVTPEVLSVTTEPTSTPLPPSETPLPTATLGPYEHVIQANETLLYIIQLYGYREGRYGDDRRDEQ